MTLRRTTPFALAAGLLAAVIPAARGGDIGGVQSGNWSSTATWIGGAVPGSGDDVFIGGNRPGGAAQSATVTLTGDAVARNLYLGYNNNGQGVLDLGDSRLTLNSLTIGVNAGTTGTLTRGTGSFTTNGLTVNNGNSLTLETGDHTNGLSLQGGSSLTTTSTGNVTGTVNVGSGSSLSLGADLSLGYGEAIRGQGTVDANGHDISAYQLALGSGGTNLVDRGDLRIASLLDINGPLPGFEITAGDSIGWLRLSNHSMTLAEEAHIGAITLQDGSSLTTTSTGNITGTVNVGSGSSLSLGTDLSLGYGEGVAGQGTVDANGHDISAYALTLGSGGTKLVDRGDLNLSFLTVNGAGTDFQFNAADTVGALSLNNGAHATTSATSNITSDLGISEGSTLSLGADLAVGWFINNRGSIDANGHNISAIRFTLTGPDANLIDATVGASGFTLDAADITLNALGNSVGGLDLKNGSTLTLMQAMGDKAGFSVDRNHWLAMGGVAIDSSSTLALIFADTPGESWLFRWQGSWLSEIDSMLAAGRITVASTWGYDVVEREGYTYIMQTSAAVPEPASVVMMGLGFAGGVGVFARRRKATTAA